MLERLADRLGRTVLETLDGDLCAAEPSPDLLVLPAYCDGHATAEPGMAAMLRVRLSVDPRETRLVREFKRGRILR